MFRNVPGYSMFRLLLTTNFHILSLKSVIPNFVACLVFLGIAFSFIKLISSSDTSTKRGEAQGSHFEKVSFRYNHLGGGDYGRI